MPTAAEHARRVEAALRVQHRPRATRLGYPSPTREVACRSCGRWTTVDPTPEGAEPVWARHHAHDGSPACASSTINEEPTMRPSTLAEVDLDADCETYGHVFGLITGNVRHCERHGCSWRDALDPDDFVTADGDLYDRDDPDQDELGYDGDNAYVLRRTAAVEADPPRQDATA